MSNYQRSAALVQLQFWHPDKRAYVPQSSCEPIDSDAHTRLLEIGRQCGRGWRVAKADRALTVPPLRRKALTAGYSRSIADMQRDYLAWAQARGLKSVHAYIAKPPPIRAEAHDRRGRQCGSVIYTGDFTWLTQEQHFAVTEHTDVMPQSIQTGASAAA